MLSNQIPPRLQDQVHDLMADLNMEERLDTIRLEQSELVQGRLILDARQADEAFAAAFLDFGLPIETLKNEEAAQVIRKRSISLPLALALDDWGIQRRSRPASGSSSRAATRWC